MIPTVIAPHTPGASPVGDATRTSRALPAQRTAPLNPLPKSGEGIKGSFGRVG